MALEDAEDANTRPLRRDLANEFDLVGNQKVHKTPSANIFMALNEIARMPASPALQFIEAHLKAATIQINDIRIVAPAQLAASSHSRCSRSSHRDQSQLQGSEHWQIQQHGPYLYGGTEGNYEAYPDRAGCPPPPHNKGRGRRAIQGGERGPNHRGNRGGGHGANQEVDQQMDLRDHLRTNIDLRGHIEDSKDE